MGENPEAAAPFLEHWRNHTCTDSRPGDCVLPTKPWQRPQIRMWKVLLRQRAQGGLRGCGLGRMLCREKQT